MNNQKKIFKVATFMLGMIHAPKKEFTRDLSGLQAVIEYAVETHATKEEIGILLEEFFRLD